MIEPTESESKAELDRFCDAHDRHPRRDAGGREGRVPTRADNPLKHAPHTAQAVLRRRVDPPLLAANWPPSPRPGCATHKFWPAVGRVDNVYGDRNLVCSCAGMEAYAPEAAG